MIRSGICHGETEALPYFGHARLQLCVALTLNERKELSGRLAAAKLLRVGEQRRAPCGATGKGERGVTRVVRRVDPPAEYLRRVWGVAA